MGVRLLRLHNIGAYSDEFNSLITFSLFTLTGIASTLLLPETNGLTLEQLSNEKQEGFVRGVKNSKLQFHDVTSPPMHMTEF